MPWPLAVFLLLAAGGIPWLWQAWPQVMVKSAVWQCDTNQQMSGLLKAVATGLVQAGGSLLLFSFLYDVPHALGLGHGKIIIAIRLATHPLKLKSSTSLTLVSSLLQGLVATGLVVVVLTISQLPARQLHMSSFRLRRGSYTLVDVLGVLLYIRALEKLCWLLRRPKLTAFTPHRVHHKGRSCGRQYLPDPEQLRSGDDWRVRLIIVLSMGMRPYSRATTVLLFSKMVSVLSWGMASALTMAVETSLTIMSLALLVHSLRLLVVKLSRHKAPVLWRQIGWATLTLTGGAMLIVATVMMWMSAVSVGRGIRPF